MSSALSLPLIKSFPTYREEDRASGNPQKQLPELWGAWAWASAHSHVDLLDPGYDQGSPAEMEESSPGL